MGASRQSSSLLHLLQTDSEAMLEEIAGRMRREGGNALQQLFRDLGAPDVSAETAVSHWNRLLAHRERLRASLGRPVNLLAALSDYLDTGCSAPDLSLGIEDDELTVLFRSGINDKLTGLNNRAYFDEVFEQQLSLAARYQTDLTLLFLDLDNFKEINDRYGHQAGDVALRTTASVINSRKRDSDIAIRYGGEEFVLLMPHTGKINGLVLGERIRTLLAATPITFGDDTFTITISGGLASFPVDGDTTTDILTTADRALYQAKGAGKNVISLYREDKRRYLRVRFNNPVFVKELGLEATASYAGQGRDICIGGILFKNPEPITVGAKIQIHTRVKQQTPLLLIGTVVRVESFGAREYDIGVALSFNELEKVAKREISGLLRAEH